MVSLVVALLTSGCSAPTPPEPAPAPAGARAKAKGKGAAAKAKRPVAAPLGVAGPVVGELTLTVLEPASPAPAPAPTEPEAVEGAAPAAPAPQPTLKHTQADLVLTFSDGQTVPVTLGKVGGTCTEVPITPIGPAENPQTPLWSVRCTDAVTTSDLAVLQLGDQITVLRAMPTPAGEMQYRPVKRVRVATGATLQRKEG
jgi:hypothetical protein